MSGKDKTENESDIKLPENPEDITAATWLDLFNRLNNTLSTIQEDLKDIKTVKSQVSSFSTEWKESVDTQLATAATKSDSQRFKINLLTNMVINQEERLEVAENRITAAYEHEIKPNLVLHGIPEKAEETKEQLEEEISNFFKSTMELTDKEIPLNDAFRMGTGRARPILLKLKYPNDKAKIFANASKLKDKTNSNKKMYFIHDDMSDKQTETRQFYRELIKENKTKQKDDQLKIKMSRGRVLVNNEVVKQKVRPTTKADILRMTEKQLEITRAAKLIPGPDHIEKGSEYVSYIMTAKTTDDVQRALNKLKIKHADATHVSAAYRLKSPTGPYKQKAIDDKDFGIGRAILKVLKEKELEETAVFIVRYYGRAHLRKRRFEIAEQLTEQAIQTWVSKKARQNIRHTRKNSQSSITSALDSQDEGLDECQSITGEEKNDA